VSWDGVLMGFVDLMLSKDDVCFKEFYVTHAELVAVTGLCATAVSNNLSVCVKGGWLRRVDFNDGGGRKVRYYINNDELVLFVNKYLR